jgi:hypothetical protein
VTAGAVVNVSPAVVVAKTGVFESPVFAPFVRSRA